MAERSPYQPFEELPEFLNYQAIQRRDEVNHPEHYTQGVIEVIDCIESLVQGKPPFEAYCLGNVVKYLGRYHKKGGVQSLEKAQWYLNKLIESASKAATK